MANNRMAIVCTKCNVGISIAKFYPRNGFIAGDKSGWGQYPLNADRVDKFFEDHAHDFDDSSFGGKQYRLGYEVGDPSEWDHYK